MAFLGANALEISLKGSRMKSIFKKIPQKKVSDKVFEQVKELIITGKLQPGDRLPSERELTNLFEVSRSSVREAILKLECLGFVVQKHGEGTFIKSFTEAPMVNYVEAFVGREDFLSDLMEIRNVLETWAASRAAEQASKGEIREMAKVVARMKKAREKGVIGHELNLDLHCRISSSTHNTFLIHMMDSISGWIEKVTDKVFYSTLYEDLETYDTLIRQHAHIVEAIEGGDAAAASEAMGEHLSYARKKADECRKRMPAANPKG